MLYRVNKINWEKNKEVIVPRCCAYETVRVLVEGFYEPLLVCSSVFEIQSIRENLLALLVAYIETIHLKYLSENKLRLSKIR